MIRRWLRSHHRSRALAVSLLILALLPTPWPKVEFHNVRHHDEPGQVCEYHDHLLRWHPDATAAADVAVLHWHWAWPSRSSSGGADHEGSTPRLHAHLGDEALPAADPAPAIVADGPGRPIAPAATPSVALDPAFGRAGHERFAARSQDPPALTFGATFAPRTSLTDRLHRWSC